MKNDPLADIPPQAAAPILLDAAGAAALCGLAVRTWWSLDARGAVPQAVRIGRRKRWRRAELVAWAAAGCPERTAWTAIGWGDGS